VAKRYTLEVGADQQKMLRYWTKYAFLRIILRLSIFFLGCIKTPRGDAPKFDDVFSAFILSYVEPFRSYALPIDGGLTAGRRNLRISLAKFLGVGKKIFEGRY